MNEDIQYLIQERTGIYKHLYRLNKEIYGLRKRLNKINDTLLGKCQHKWEIDNTYMDEHTVYKCGICNCYPDYNTKMSVIDFRNFAAAWCFCIEVYVNTREWPAAQH